MNADARYADLVRHVARCGRCALVKRDTPASKARVGCETGRAAYAAWDEADRDAFALLVDADEVGLTPGAT